MTLDVPTGSSLRSVFRLAAAALVATAGWFGLGDSARAATLIDFNGDKNADPYVEDLFAVAPNRIVNGNCLSGGCLALNDNESSTLTFTLAPGKFTLNSLNFNLLGNGTGNTLFVQGSNGGSASFTVGATYAKNSYHFFDFGDTFKDVTSVVFSTGDGGNVRIDNLMASTPAPVPLPAAAWLLLPTRAYVPRKVRAFVEALEAQL